jgi:hypothetical protein
MKLHLERQTLTDASTIGSLSIDGVFECYTLEDVVRDPGVKIHGATAIPYGEYTVTIDHSTRFNRMMPHVLNVPDFEGIRIHPGNTDADTEGCILLGTVKGTNKILNSKIAFNAFFPKLQEGLKLGAVTIEISKTAEVDPIIKPDIA